MGIWGRHINPEWGFFAWLMRDFVFLGGEGRSADVIFSCAVAKELL
jgi:hypothetical protein